MISSLFKKSSPAPEGPAAPAPAVDAAPAQALPPASAAFKEQVHARLHDQAQRIPNTYQFKKVSSEEAGLKSDLQAILKRFKVKNDPQQKYNNAVLSADGKTLMVVSDGLTALKQNFGGASWIGRVFNGTLGWARKLFTGVDTNVATKKYKELFTYLENNDENNMVHESPKHLFKGLKDNHYHAVSIFRLDEKSGKFKKNPAVVSVIDSYQLLVEQQLKYEKDKIRLSKLQNLDKRMENYFAVDKIIPIDETETNFQEVFHQIAEGLYQAQPYDLLTLPGKVHGNPNVNTNDLNYAELPWFKISETNDKKWKPYGDFQLLQPDYFANSGEMKEFQSKLVPYAQNLTIVRPIAQANQAIDNKIGWLDAWQQMYSGGERRITDKESEKIFKMNAKINDKIINKHNVQMQLAAEMTQEPLEEEKKGFLKNLFGSKK